ncbi:MAG: dynamin family protein [Gemmatimonadaceae bacterium]
MEQVLTPHQSDLVARERRLIMQVRDALAQADGSRTDLDHLARLITEMDELFLLVVAGEYNAGKSTFINALLGAEVFAMGDLPTTRAISILRHGESGPPETLGEHTLLYHYPLDVLRDLDIVDTPGTNSIERMEEEITRGFVPRADLVLFVTTLLQPLTASELDFLTHISEWGRKVIFVINGVDRRNSDEQIERVREYIVREVSARLGPADPPTTYCISALQALRAKIAARAGAPVPDADPKNEFPALERYLLQTLRDTERVRLKLLSPVGVLRNILGRNLTALDSRLTVLHEDARVLGSVRQQLDAYLTETKTDSERYLLELRSVLAAVEQRGRSWLERNIRIGNIRFLRNREAVENRFRSEVVMNAPHEIEDVVHRIVDWTVKRNLKMWTAVFSELDAHTARLRASGALAADRDTEFQYNREELFTKLREPVQHRLAAFNAEAEAREIVESMQDALTQAFGVNVLALGLGAALVAVFSTAALDVTGVLAATLFAIAGWFLIPARRRRLVRELEERIGKLSVDLSALVSAKFQEQLGRYEQQFVEVVQPYERFIETQRTKLEKGARDLRTARDEVDALEARINK